MTGTLTVITKNYPEMSVREAEALSEYLPVNLRNFWLAMHPIVQQYTYDVSCEPEHFFSLVQMEFARSGQWVRMPETKSASNTQSIEWKPK